MAESIPRADAASSCPGFLRLCAARALAALHVVIVSMFVAGWALPARAAWIAVLVSAPVVEAGWWLFGDRCLLTLLEKRLRGELPGRDEALEGVSGAPPNFLAEQASRLLGRPVPHAAMNVLARAVMWSAFAIAGARLAWQG